MALITCPECHKEVSSLAQTCPICGYPIKSRPPKTPRLNSKKMRLIASVCLAILIIILLSFFFIVNPIITKNKDQKILSAASAFIDKSKYDDALMISQGASPKTQLRIKELIQKKEEELYQEALKYVDEQDYENALLCVAGIQDEDKSLKITDRINYEYLNQVDMIIKSGNNMTDEMSKIFQQSSFDPIPTQKSYCEFDDRVTGLKKFKSEYLDQGIQDIYDSTNTYILSTQDLYNWFRNLCNGAATVTDGIPQAMSIMNATRELETEVRSAIKQYSTN